MKTRKAIQKDMEKLVSLRVKEYHIAGRPPTDDETKIELMKLLNRYARRLISLEIASRKDLPGVDLDIVKGELSISYKWAKR